MNTPRPVADPAREIEKDPINLNRKLADLDPYLGWEVEQGKGTLIQTLAEILLSTRERIAYTS